MRNEIHIDKLGTPVMNHVFVEVEDTSSKFKTQSGIIIKSNYADDAWSDGVGYSVSEFTPRSGVVARLPKIITSFQYDFETENELELDDEVFWPFSVCSEHSVLVCEGKKFVKVNYHDILARKRNGEITPINGYVLLKAVPVVHKALSYSTTIPVSDEWDIVAVPDKLPVFDTVRKNVKMKWEVGDRILHMVKQSPYKLERSINRSLEEVLYAVPFWMVLVSR